MNAKAGQFPLINHLRPNRRSQGREDYCNAKLEYEALTSACATSFCSGWARGRLKAETLPTAMTLPSAASEQWQARDATTATSPTPMVAAVDDTATSSKDPDVKDMGETADSSLGAEITERPPVAPPPSATRPILQRNAIPRATPDLSQQGYGGAGAAPLPHAPAPPLPTDSLSLAQLRKIVSEVNRPEQAAYDFVYTDMGLHAEEIDEWFMYQFWQWVRLSSAQKAFEWHWNQETTAGGIHGAEIAWEDADHDIRTRFVQAAIAGVQSNDAALRSASIGKLVYLVLGRWGDTAMPNAPAPEKEDEDGEGGSRARGSGPGGKSIASLMQLRAIKAGVECLASLEGLPVVWEALRHAFELHWYALLVLDMEE